MPSPFLLYSCLLLPLALAIFMSSTKMLTLNLSFKSLSFILRKFESCELPISPLISFHFLSSYKFCVNSILCCVLFAITITLSSIDLALILILIPTLKKISSLSPQFECGSLPIRPLDVPSHFFHLQVLS